MNLSIIIGLLIVLVIITIFLYKKYSNEIKPVQIVTPVPQPKPNEPTVAPIPTPSPPSQPPTTPPSTPPSQPPSTPSQPPTTPPSQPPTTPPSQPPTTPPSQPPTTPPSTSTPIDCQVGPWINQGTCNVETGKQRQVRTITQQAMDGGASCPVLTQEINCPVDCVPGDWSAWSNCDKATGLKTRNRNIIQKAKNGGKECNSSDLQENQECSVNCEYRSWLLGDICNTTTNKLYETRGILYEGRNGGTSCNSDVNSADRKRDSTTNCNVDSSIYTYIQSKNTRTNPNNYQCLAYNGIDREPTIRDCDNTEDQRFVILNSNIMPYSTASLSDMEKVCLDASIDFPIFKSCSTAVQKSFDTEEKIYGSYKYGNYITTDNQTKCLSKYDSPNNNSRLAKINCDNGTGQWNTNSYVQWHLTDAPNPSQVPLYTY
jgi:hypothetical protein